MTYLLIATTPKDVVMFWTATKFSRNLDKAFKFSSLEFAQKTLEMERRDHGDWRFSIESATIWPADTRAGQDQAWWAA